MTAAGHDARRLSRNLAKVAALRFFLWMHLFSAVIVPFFRDWGRLGFSAIFLVQAWFMVWVTVLEAPTGAVADRFGRRVSLASSGFVMAAAALVYASVPNITVFLAGEILFAVAMTLSSGADEALVYDTLAALGRTGETTRVMARLEAWKLGGLLGGAVAGALVASRLGVRAPLLLQPIPALAAGLVALSLAEPPGAERGRRPAPYLKVFREGVRHLAQSRVLRSLALDMSANAAVVWLVVWLYQAQLGRAGLPLGAFGLVHGAMTLAQIALLSRVSTVERLVGGRRRLMRLTALVPPLCLVGLAATANPAASIGLSIVAAALGFTRLPLFSAVVNRDVPSERRATVLSAISALRALAVAVLYPLFGFLVDRSLPLALAALGAVGLAVAVLFAAPREALDPDSSPTAS
jgi:MFS family permease